MTKIADNPNLTLKIIVDENADWKYKVLEPENKRSGEYRLILTDEDIE